MGEGLIEPFAELKGLQFAFDHGVHRAIGVVDHKQALKTEVLEQCGPDIAALEGPILVHLYMQVLVGIAPERVVLDRHPHGFFHGLYGFAGMERAFGLLGAVQVMGDVKQ